MSRFRSGTRQPRTHGIHVLGTADVADFIALAQLDPVINVFAEYRARTTRLDPKWLGGEVWGKYDEGQLVAACHAGANLVPVGCTPADAADFARYALSRRRTIATLVGPEKPVDVMWGVLNGRWSTPRDVRRGQPHLELADAPLIEPDPQVRLTRPDEVDRIYPACVAMYTEEVGVSPEEGGGRALYRARIASLIAQGWSFVRFDEHGQVIFKAEVACASPSAAQIQGVYVAPRYRGSGIAAPAMAAVVATIRREIAPVASLYVNEWNEPARRAYQRVGFIETARFSTVMF